ncbi:hypothetical protein [Ectopseudomonas oleovorans]|uniref:hypothetical protein n=1 Tax=Ectopseudomonas oleovorans TaxID=301 RepID=UPI0035AF0A3E
MNLVGRFLLSSTVYHLRAVVSVPGLPGLGYELVKNPDGSITLGGEATPGSDITITWPDGGTSIPVVNEDGSWSETSPPGQPDGETQVKISLNAIQFEDDFFEQMEDGSLIIPEITLITNAIIVENGGFEVTDDGSYISFEVV